MTVSIVAAVLFVVLIGLYLSQTAGRLDRLHIRVDLAQSTLRQELARRAAVSSELAQSQLLDPATSIVLAETAHAARSEAPLGSAVDQTALTQALEIAFGEPEQVEEVQVSPGGADLLDELASSCRRTQLAHGFLDDAVLACRRVRGHRVVRLFGLAGTAPWPKSIDFDDSLPFAEELDAAGGVSTSH